MNNAATFGKITSLVFDNGEHYLAHTTNGMRIGMNNVMYWEVPFNHGAYDAMSAVTEETAEEFIDKQVEAGNIDPRVFTRGFHG